MPKNNGNGGPPKDDKKVVDLGKEKAKREGKTPEDQPFSDLPVAANDPPPMNPAAQKCLARRKWCVCGHRFAKDEGLHVGALKKRLDPKFDLSRLGRCSECGRIRRLCTKVAMKDRLVCRTHGGKAGRKPMDPLMIILDDERLNRIAELQENKDDSLRREFYVLKTYIQDVLGAADNMPEDELGRKFIDLDAIERITALFDRTVGIQERHMRLMLQIPQGDDFKEVEFSDPRVALALKEKFRQVKEQTVQGTLLMVLKALRQGGDRELTAQVLELLPERFQNYVAVSQAKKTEGAVVEDQGQGQEEEIVGDDTDSG